MYGWLIFFGLIFLGIFYFYLLLRDKKQHRELLKNYNAEENKSRRTGSQFVGGLEKSPEGEFGVERFDKSEGGFVLPPTAIKSTGKDSKRPRGIFGKRKHRR